MFTGSRKTRQPRPDGRRAIRRGAATACVSLLLLLWAPAASRAQSLDVKISLTSLSPPRVRVEGRRAEGASRWSFRDSYAGLLGLGARIENFALADEQGAGVQTRRLAPGEFEAARPANRFSYDVRLDPPSAPAEAAHVSWLAGRHGSLMLGDLLPLPLSGGVTVNFDLPAGWSIASVEERRADGRYEVADAEQALFLTGRDVRERRGRRGAEFVVAFAGEWAFADEDVVEMVGDILAAHAETLGDRPPRRTLTVLAPFPAPAAGHVWSAETRGRTVFLLSGDVPSKSAGLAHLSVPLAHELFHLWVPNALALDGDYEWFYEGFTLYQAMRSGVRLGHLTFGDYLNAMGRAFDNYRAARGAGALSLVEASRRRWTTGARLVYNQGMLVAFLYDLELRHRTGGRQTLETVYRELFRQYKSPHGRRDANAAIITVLGGMKGMRSFTEKYIETATEIDLPSALAPFGLRVETGPVRTRVTVAGTLSGAQRDLLRKLGYNGLASLGLSESPRAGSPAERIQASE